MSSTAKIVAGSPRRLYRVAGEREGKCNEVKGKMNRPKGRATFGGGRGGAQRRLGNTA